MTSDEEKYSLREHAFFIVPHNELRRDIIEKKRKSERGLDVKEPSVVER